MFPSCPQSLIFWVREKGNSHWRKKLSKMVDGIHSVIPSIYPSYHKKYEPERWSMFKKRDIQRAQSFLFVKIREWLTNAYLWDDNNHSVNSISRSSACFLAFLRLMAFQKGVYHSCLYDYDDIQQISIWPLNAEADFP